MPPGRPTRSRGPAARRRLPQSREHGRRWPAPLTRGRSPAPERPGFRRAVVPVAALAHAYAVAPLAHAVASPADPLALPLRLTDTRGRIRLTPPAGGRWA